MRHYDVFVNPALRRRPDAPFVINLQHHRHAPTPSTLVAPLSLRGVPSRRDPMLSVLGAGYVMLTLEVSPIDVRLLGDAPVENLAAESFRIQLALDLVFSAAG